ncbi:MAG: radical SAM protein [Candidatus Methanoperedens sp.]|nr:radical SAM protein [Candidatus Methanoperedens sp.]
MSGKKTEENSIKIVFINPNTRYLGGLFTVYPPMGLLYISSILLENKYNVSIIDADIDDLSLEDIKEKLRIERPQIVGITMNTFQTKSTFETAKAVKDVNPEIIVVVGGPHPTIVEKEVLEACGSIDVSVMGEGEFTMLELAKRIENGGNLGEVDGICYRDDGIIKMTAPRKFIEDLDTLPLPAIELVQPIERYRGPFPTGARPSIQVMASRGCPFKCTFCSNPVWGKKVRFRSPESILSEVEHLYKDFGIKEIFFQDDTFNLNGEWFEKICNGIIDRGLNDKIIFKTPFRVNKNHVDVDLLNLAKKAGFWMIFYGVESGNQKILNITRKGTTLEEIERAFKLTRKAGIKTYGSFMIGNIDETPETIKDAIEFAKKIDPDYYGFAIATPYPGSEFYETAKSRGYLLITDFTKYDFRKCILRTEHLKETDVEKFYSFAPLAVKKYKRSLTRKIKRFIELFPEIGLKRAVWEIQDTGIEDIDHLPVHKDDVNLATVTNNVNVGVNDTGVLGKGWHQAEYQPQPNNEI